jgi:hypothetical protein
MGLIRDLAWKFYLRKLVLPDRGRMGAAAGGYRRLFIRVKAKMEKHRQYEILKAVCCQSSVAG